MNNDTRVVDAVERPMIALPCGHLADRPTKSKATVECTACPRAYQLTLVDGGRVWNAVEIEVVIDAD